MSTNLVAVREQQECALGQEQIRELVAIAIATGEQQTKEMLHTQMQELSEHLQVRHPGSLGGGGGEMTGDAVAIHML